MPLVPFYRQAFLRQQPRRYAVMQPQQHFEQTGEKYYDYNGELTDEQIGLLLAGRAAFAVPYAENGLAQLLAFDVDSDHLDDPYAPVRALLDEATRRGLFAFGQYDPQRRRGYVWIPFDDLVNVARIATLGDQMIGTVSRPGWKIENRASQKNAGSDTRLPLCRHTWTGIYGVLLLDGQQLDIDSDPAGALGQLAGTYRENPIDLLPTPPPAEAKPTSHRSRSANGSSVTIDRFNAEHDLIDLLIRYNARPVGRRTFFCPFHDDRHASLSVYRNRDGKLVCHCKSRQSNCPLAERHGADAFYVHCIGEGLTEQEALRRLNGHDQPNGGPQTPPAAPGGPPPTPKGSPIPPQTTRAAQQPVQRATTPPESVAAIRNGVILAAALDTTLTNVQRAILRAVLDSTPTTEAYQSVAYYARHAPCSERAARYALRALEHAGYLVRTRDRGPDGQTNVYRISLPTRGGGQIAAPTWNTESLPSPESDRASRGGQGETAAERASAGPEPITAAESAEVVSWPDGASYDPAADLTAQAATVPARSWGVDLRPKELYAFCHAARDAAARIQLRADLPDVDAEVDTQQLAIAGELGDPAEQDPPADPQPVAVAGSASGPRPSQRQIPTDPQQRRCYFALLGKAKKSKSAAQARHLRELAAALLVEVAADDLALPPALPTGRTRARPATPRATVLAPAQAALGLELPGEEVSGPATAPPTSSPGWGLDPGDVWLEQQRQNLRAAEARGDGAKVAFYRYVLGEGGRAGATGGGAYGVSWCAGDAPGARRGPPPSAPGPELPEDG